MAPETMVLSGLCTARLFIARGQRQDKSAFLWGHCPAHFFGAEQRDQQTRLRVYLKARTPDAFYLGSAQHH